MAADSAPNRHYPGMLVVNVFDRTRSQGMIPQEPGLAQAYNGTLGYGRWGAVAAGSPRLSLGAVSEVEPYPAIPHHSNLGGHYCLLPACAGRLFDF
jgi:hypothetical protein